MERILNAQRQQLQHDRRQTTTYIQKQNELNIFKPSGWIPTNGIPQQYRYVGFQVQDLATFSQIPFINKIQKEIKSGHIFQNFV